MMERTECPKCGQHLEDRLLIRCPNADCRTVFSEYEQNQHALVTQLKEDKEEFITDVVKRVRRHLWKQVVTFILAILTILGVGIWQVYTRVTDFISTEIASNFADTHIQQTLNKVATTHAKDLINEKVNPAIEKARTDISRLQTQLQKQLGQDTEKMRFEYQAQLRQDVNDIRTAFLQELESLHSEIDYQKKLREIQLWKSLAIANCDLDSFNSLDKYTSDEEDLKLAAQAAVFEVQELLPYNLAHGPSRLLVAVTRRFYAPTR